MEKDEFLKAVIFFKSLMNKNEEKCNAIKMSHGMKLERKTEIYDRQRQCVRVSKDRENF